MILQFKGINYKSNTTYEELEFLIDFCDLDIKDNTLLSGISEMIIFNAKTNEVTVEHTFSDPLRFTLLYYEVLLDHYLAVSVVE